VSVIGRRIVPAVPPLSGLDLSNPEDLKRLQEQLTAVEDFLQVVRDNLDEGAPVPHIVTHNLNTGDDPIPTAIPANPTGPAAAIGSANSLLRSDCIIEQGIVTTKGDLLGRSTVAARVAVGANGFLLVADSTQATGVKWAASAASIEDSEILALYGM